MTTNTANKKVALIIASNGYQPIEYGHTRKVLEEAGIQVNSVSDQAGIAQASPRGSSPHECKDSHCAQSNHYDTAQVDVALSNVNPDEYDGIFIVGGPGALDHLNNQATYSIMQRAASAGKAFGAICISPRILAYAGLLDGKKATGWDNDEKLASIFDTHNTSYVKEDVVIDGNIVTAVGPRAATDFGKAIVRSLEAS